MRVLLQRVKHASVKVDDTVCGQIEQGFLLLVGITDTDTEEIVKKHSCVYLKMKTES